MPWKRRDLARRMCVSGYVMRGDGPPRRWERGRTSIHSLIEKLNPGHLYRLPLCFGQTITLIVCFRRVDRINLPKYKSCFLYICFSGPRTYASPRNQTAKPARHSHRRRRSGRRTALKFDEQLFDAFVSCEIYGRANRVPY